jgi:hypothetical protein
LRFAPGKASEMRTVVGMSRKHVILSLKKFSHDGASFLERRSLLWKNNGAMRTKLIL